MSLGQVLGIAIILFVISEYVFSYKKSWRTSKKQLMQLPFFLLIGMIFVPILGQFIAQSIPHRLTFFTNMPFIPAVLSAFLIGEFGYYWYHRFEHTNPFLWKIHMVHHHQPSVNFINFWIAHPIEIALNFLVTNIPLYLLGFRMEVIGTYLVVATILYMFSHLNTNVKIGFLKYVIGNPQLHRFHHSTDMKQAKNFCGRLPLWDLVFNTFYYQPGEGVKEVGLAAVHTDHPTSIWGGIIYPFRHLKNTMRSKLRVKYDA